MVKPNWDIFKAKFSDNPQNNFEWFCYLLLCKEFNKTGGVSRYKNQSAIETNPIEKEGEVIGWQAKFYGKALSSYKNDLLKTLKTAKKDYPNITKLIFYTNQEWGQNKGQKPKGEKELEKHSNKLGVKLEWRTASYFESPFVSIENENIAQHFFSMAKSVLDLIRELQTHSDNILREIQPRITFRKQSIEIDRSRDLERIKTNLGQVLILSGVGGVGKTALVKNYYEELKEKTSVYIFKATEFELRSVNELFAGYNFLDFIKAHKEENRKTIVIDSAEKLLDLKNTDPFKEFLSVLAQNSWNIIFTTRDSYLEDLNYQFFEIHKTVPSSLIIRNLELPELSALSDYYHFSLPKDEKLLEFIRNPFYLNEYLRFYNEKVEINYIDFKNTLWDKIVKKSKPSREQCFLKIAFERANEGQFFVNPKCESQILDNELVKDGILGYESPHGYFITHDIYEEWALEKIIEGAFEKKNDTKSFFHNIGDSLPMRRAFRKWVSEKLFLKDNGMKVFIEDILKNGEIDSFWKDEVLVSVLLSDYSESFFHIFSNELLINNQELLKKLTFLLRIACKEVDADCFRQLGIRNINLFSLNYVPTIPKGQGWQNLIKFVSENLDKIGFENINFVLPIIHDWNSRHKEGATTRFSGLIALRYYQWLIEKDVYSHNDETRDNLLQSILYGSSEIKSELEYILEEILKNKWKSRRDPFCDLSKYILTKPEGLNASRILPAHVLRLANLFWSFTPSKNERYGRHSTGVEQYFDIEDDHLDYFPASSYQTPIHWLLQSSLQETIDFILEFTNKTADYYAKSEFAKYEVTEAEVFVEKEKPIKQYISNRLWCIYRGTQVAPHALESMHMALEKYFLENGQQADSKTLEGWLLYLLRNSKSASISAVVASIVLAYPEKTFNVAKIIFRTKKFFLYDTSRWVLDQTHKSSLLALKTGFGVIPKNEIHNNERLRACDDKHRQLTLEHLFLQYQMFRSKEISEEQSKARQKVLWEILDEYYKELSSSSKETDDDKTWRLYLARMDRRKMSPSTEKTENGTIIHLNPELESGLKEYSEKSLENNSKLMKYSALNLWVSYKMGNDDKYKQYEQYEKNPKLALKEAKEIIAKLKTIIRPDLLNGEHTEDESFYLFNHAIPAEVCSVLVRDYFENLSQEEKVFCKDYILKVAFTFVIQNQQSHVSNGAQSIISVLPTVLERFPTETDVKMILLCGLFNDYPIDMVGTPFSAFSGMAIHKLWESKFEDAQSILIGYLFLKPKLDELRKRLRQENCKRNIYSLNESEVMTEFLKGNEKNLQKTINNQLSIGDAGEIEQLDLHVLKTAFQLIPLKTENDNHKTIAKKIISAFSGKILSNDRDEKVDYRDRRDFLEKLAYFVLSSQKEEIREYLKPFLEKFNNSEAIADLLKEFISAEDHLNLYENFWEVWCLFKEKLVEVCKNGDDYGYTNRIICSYLFAQTSWKESATEWHTLKDENKTFFKEISGDIGHCPSTLYAISKLLTGIGSLYLNDGIGWLSDILQKNTNILNVKLETNTIYYLENLIKRYVYKNRERIRKTKKLRQEVLMILEFLISKGSVIGYMVRESVL